MSEPGGDADIGVACRVFVKKAEIGIASRIFVKDAETGVAFYIYFSFRRLR